MNIIIIIIIIIIRVFRGSALSFWGKGGYYYSEVYQTVSICRPSGKGHVEGKLERWEVKKVR